MPDLIPLSIEEARKKTNCLVELKVDGTRITFKDHGLYSDRDIDRTDRFGHVMEEVRTLNWCVRGEMAIPGGNVLQVNARKNWPRAKFHIFDLYDYNGQDIYYQGPFKRREILEEIMAKNNFMHLRLPMRFASVDEGWDFILRHDLEGIVLKDPFGNEFKVKQLKEEKLRILRHEPGKSKGAFIIVRDGVLGRVSGTSEGLVSQYHKLAGQGADVYAEIEYPFLTEDGLPYQPRLRRLGTPESLAMEA